MIKVMNLVALIMAPLIVQTQDTDARPLVWLVSAIGIVIIVLSVRRSDREIEDIEIAPQAQPAETPVPVPGD